MGVVEVVPNTKLGFKHRKNNQEHPNYAAVKMLCICTTRMYPQLKKTSLSSAIANPSRSLLVSEAWHARDSKTIQLHHKALSQAKARLSMKGNKSCI